MSNPTGSNVSEIKVRTSGAVLCRVDAHNIGGDDVSVSVRLGDITRIRRTEHSPAHIRIQFGPIVWEVTDYMAWNDVLAALTTAVDVFDALELR